MILPSEEMQKTGNQIFTLTDSILGVKNKRQQHGDFGKGKKEIGRRLNERKVAYFEGFLYDLHRS